MEERNKLAAPCGLYCGVCAVLIAHRDNNTKFKERLAPIYNVTPNQIKCEGCFSTALFGHCQVCAIRTCVEKKEIEGCHKCNDFPCQHIHSVRLSVGKKVMLRAIPTWRELGTERFMEEEEKRYQCPDCGYRLFRGTRKCRNCGSAVDVD